MKLTRAEPIHTHHHGNYLSWFDKLFVKVRDHTEGMNQHMFKEDFQNIFRHSNRTSEELFGIKTNNDTLAHRLLDGFETQSSPRSIDEKLTEITEEIAQSLLSNGKAFYYLHDNSEKAEMHIVSYNGESIIRIARCVFQFLPKRVEKNWDKDDLERQRELRLLNAKKTLCFGWPSPIRRIIFSQKRVLASLDKNNGSIAMGFLPQATLGNPNPRSDFDFKHWRDAQDFALYKATRQTGWNGRKHDSRKRSDFFDCHRLIRFRRNQLNFRDSILRQLGCELTRVGQHYLNGFQLEISTTEALPTVSHLDDLDDRLSREEVGFSEIVDYCFKR